MSMSLHRSKPWTARIVAGLVLCAPLAVLADDATSAGQRTSAQPVATSATSSLSGQVDAETRSGAPARSKARGKTASGAAAATVAASSATAMPTANPSASASQSATPGAPSVICFQNSLRCFTPRRGAPSAAGSESRTNALDLRAPEITRVFSQAELSQKLQEPEETSDIQETVQVQGERQITPVSVGLMAIPWAIVHPTQAWRILMPVPEAK